MSTTGIAVQGDKYDQREMVETIKQTVAKGATDAQLKMFIEICRSTGLNPFLREIWYVADKGIIMAGRDGFLRVANENPNFDGMETRVERDERNMPIKATCSVWRKDRSHPIVCEAYYSEYKKGSPVWTQYPSAMIGKVAEVLALKRSFSINGVVSEEEIGNDGAGTREAAQDVAKAKIAKMEQTKNEKRAEPKPVIHEAETTPILDAKQEPWEDDPELAMHHDIVEQAKNAKPSKLPYDKFKMLPEMQVVKKRYLALNDEAAYRRVLRRFGVQKSDQLPSDDGGVMARAAYKELLWLVGELETAAGKAMQPAAPESPKAQAKPPKDLYDYIDWESATASKDWQEAWLRVGGKVYQLWDGNYKEWKATSAASTK